MKTREQAEALNETAKELGYYHWEHFLEDHDTPEKLFNAGAEYAQLKINELSQHKDLSKTCGYYVKEKSDSKLTTKQAESICFGFYKELVTHLESGLSVQLFSGEQVFKEQLEKALK